MNHRAIVGCVAWLAGAAACTTPVPAIRLELNTTSEQSCPSSDCRSVPVPCPTVMSIKIFDPNHPDQPFLTQCTPVAANSTADLCALNSVNLDATPIPVKHVEVQVAVFAAASLARNPDNSFICPDVPFAATGFPVEQTSLGPGAISPAVGGVGWYDPGDSQVDVNLGCTNLAAMQTCVSKNLINVAAKVVDFATGTLVLQGTPEAPHLTLGIGEPHSENSQTTLDGNDLRPIGVIPGQDGTPEVWGGPVDVPIDQFACTNVLESVAQATATVTCQPKAASTESIDVRGVWIGRKELTAILSALGSMAFPDAGLTIGMVINDDGQPVHDQPVAVAKGTLQYLSEATDGSGAFTASPKPSSTSTIFVSTDATFPTEFMVDQGPGQPSLIQIGGRIAGHVTVVLLGMHGNGA